MISARVNLAGGDQVQLSVAEPYATYVFQLFAPGTTDTGFAQAIAVDGATTNGNSPDVITLQAPYSGNFVLAVCENVANNNCPTVDSSSGANPMGPYTFKPTLIGGGVRPGVAARETRATGTIASSRPLVLGVFEAGGGGHIDFWRVTLARGDVVQLSVAEPYATYVFQLFKATTTDATFAQAVAVAGTTTNGNSPDVTTFQAPSTGTFVLAVCENVANNNCPTVDSDSGANPMGPYTFTSTLISAGAQGCNACRPTAAAEWGCFAYHPRPER